MKEVLIYFNAYNKKTNNFLFRSFIVSRFISFTGFFDLYGSTVKDHFLQNYFNGLKNGYMVFINLFFIKSTCNHLPLNLFAITKLEFYILILITTIVRQVSIPKSIIFVINIVITIAIGIIVIHIIWIIDPSITIIWNVTAVKEK